VILINGLFINFYFYLIFCFFIDLTDSWNPPVEEDGFSDRDSQDDEVLASDSLIQNGLCLLAEMAASSDPETSPERTRLVVLELCQFFKNMDKLCMHNGNGSALNSFSRLVSGGNLFQVLEIVLEDTGRRSLLETDLISEILRLLHAVARKCLRPIARQHAPPHFEPKVCMLVFRSLTHLLRHLHQPNCDSAENKKCRDFFVNFVAVMAKLQSESSFQLYPADKEKALVDLIGQVTNVIYALRISKLRIRCTNKCPVKLG
jgi:hypothetical protein